MGDIPSFPLASGPVSSTFFPLKNPNIVCLGISHQSAGVEVREAFAIPDACLPQAVRSLTAHPAIGEAVILSTCNRVEMYAAADDPACARAALLEFAQNQGGRAPLPGAFYVLEDEAAARHLFRVASGLESMVLGETEILGQVKKAYAAALGACATGRTLNKLFQRAFRVGKEVRTRTKITCGPVSVGSVAVDLAESIFGRLDPCRAMILGAGETSELTARALLSRGVKNLFVVNRTFDRAAALAQEMNAEALRFEEGETFFGEMDILICSTAAPHYIVTREQLAPIMAARPGRPLLVIDLAVPRNVEPAVSELADTFFHDIDSLQTIARQGLETRQKEVVHGEALLARHLAEFFPIPCKL